MNATLVALATVLALASGAGTAIVMNRLTFKSGPVYIGLTLCLFGLLGSLACSLVAGQELLSMSSIFGTTLLLCGLVAAGFGLSGTGAHHEYPNQH